MQMFARHIIETNPIAFLAINSSQWVMIFVIAFLKTFTVHFGCIELVHQSNITIPTSTMNWRHVVRYLFETMLHSYLD